MPSKSLTIREKKVLAEDLYFNTGLSQKEISAKVKVTEKTFSKWKHEGDWELLKQAQTVTSQNIINNLYEKAYKLSEEEDINADALVKIANTIDKLSNKKTTISQIINVFKDFTTFAFGEDAELAKQINRLQRKYVDTKISE